MSRINEHFYWLSDGKFENDCGRCCCHCPYMLDGKGEHHWIACSRSCITDKTMVGKSCSNCKHSTYGQKL